MNTNQIRVFFHDGTQADLPPTTRTIHDGAVATFVRIADPSPTGVVGECVVLRDASYAPSDIIYRHQPLSQWRGERARVETTAGWVPCVVEGWETYAKRLEAAHVYNRATILAELQWELRTRAKEWMQWGGSSSSQKAADCDRAAQVLADLPPEPGIAELPATCGCRSYLGNACIREPHEGDDVHRASTGTRWRGDADKPCVGGPLPDDVLAALRACIEAEVATPARDVAWEKLTNMLMERAGLTPVVDGSDLPEGVRVAQLEILGKLYEISATSTPASLIETAARHAEDILMHAWGYEKIPEGEEGAREAR